MPAITTVDGRLTTPSAYRHDPPRATSAGDGPIVTCSTPLEPGSAETELTLTETALQQGQIGLAGAALREVSSEERMGGRYALDAGQLAQAEGRSERARYWFSQVEAGQPGEARVLFVLARWHAGLASATDQARARQLLLGLTRRPEERLAAWRALVALDLKRRDWGRRGWMTRRCSARRVRPLPIGLRSST